MEIKHPLIILGAGASHDYIPDSDRTRDARYKPPLADGLCDPRIFTEIVGREKYPHAQALIADLRASTQQGVNLETHLGIIRDRAEAIHDENRKRQLVDFEFYLQDLFQKISDNYGQQPTNNLAVLTNYLRDFTKNESQAVGIATFNYDLLAEQCLGIEVANDPLDSLRPYISGLIKLIKLHGSCDWMYIFGKNIAGPSYDTWLADPFSQPLPGADWAIIRTRSSSIRHGDDNVSLRPAVAIPLPDKHGYVCPPSHIKELAGLLNQTNAILIIGWSAGDEHLIKTMEEQIRNQTKVTIVSRDTNSAQGIKEKLHHIKNLSFDLNGGGFSKFARGPAIVDFFSQ
jgi:hypothetical protein